MYDRGFSLEQIKLLSWPETSAKNGPINTNTASKQTTGTWWGQRGQSNFGVKEDKDTLVFQHNDLGHSWESCTKTPASAPDRTGNLSSTTPFSWNLNSMRWKKSSELNLEPSEGFILTLSLGQTFPFLASLSMFRGAGLVAEVEFDRKGTLFQFCLSKQKFQITLFPV